MKISENHNSKPEVDFVALPTAISNVWWGLKMPLKIFRQGRQEGVELKNVQSHPKFQKFISQKLVVRFLRNFAHFYGSTMSITCSIQNNSHLPRKFPGSILVFFWFWGWPLNWPPNIDCYGGFVEVVETVATRYYSTHYVMVKKFEPPYLENWKSEFPVILQFFRGRQYL